ncbi:hypothetical protein [Streptomyces sp. NPDC048643]|uniref:hypothetical protein n=1 Tax=Streptomyces sp. NPDC048643 TaxID=3155637 RepID=UPI00341E1049
MRTRARLTAAVAASALLSGCAIGSAAGPDHRAPAAIRLPWAPPPTAEVRDLHLPFDSYDLSVNEVYRGEQAEDLLTRACMADRDLTWTLVDRDENFPDLRNRRRYGVIEQPVARDFGYHANATMLGSTRVTAAKMTRDARLAPEARKPAKDCQKLAHTKLGGKDVSLAKLARLSSETLDFAQHEPSVAATITRWRACMKTAGHPYKDPFDAANDPRWSRSKRPGTEEKETALADVRCKARTRLVPTWLTAETARQKTVLRKERTYFTTLSTYKKRYLQAADKVILSEQNAG